MSTPDHIIEWETLIGEVALLRRQGRYDRAVVAAKKALQVAEQAWPDPSDYVATSLIPITVKNSNNIALISGDYKWRENRVGQINWKQPKRC
jgi:DNA-directed RNA polymerase subunit K/omega